MTERPTSAVPVERVRGERPASEDWRADDGSRSRHSRLADALVQPLEEHDRGRAEEICGEICRRALLDLAPALVLLPAAERRRAQVLAAYALTLFDFAHQPGLDGDRLAEINRWEFQLEEALDGQPAGQPIFVLMAVEETAAPWRREGLDKLLSAARRRAARGASEKPLRPGDDHLLADGLAELLLGGPPGDDAVRLASAILAVARLRADAGRALPASWAGALDKRPTTLPRRWRPAARYLQLASRRILENRRRAERDAPDRRGSQIGAATRLAFLLRARLFG